jgi:hypothetical protein
MGSHPLHNHVIIEQSEFFNLRSQHVNAEFLIKIWLPESYSTNENRYPVLYLLDGDFAFGMATDIVQYMIWGKHIPELIIVSPSYGTKGEGNQRGRDFLYTPVSFLTNITPGGDNFMHFLVDELVPEIDTRYRTVPDDRTLEGYSGGCWFLMQAIFKAHPVFKRMIGVDGCGPEEVFDLEQKYADTHSDLPLRLFLSSREEEGCECQFIKKLNSRNYPNLMAEFYYQDAVGHFTAPADGLVRGLVAVFEGNNEQTKSVIE